MSRKNNSVNSICFVNADNYPVLNPEFGAHYIGGESVQQTLLAKEFARRGWKVSMVCEDYGQPDGETVSNIEVWKTYNRQDGIPLLRFVYPRFVKFWGALKRANADFYYQSCASASTGFVSMFCRRNDRRMIFRVAHDLECMPSQELIRFRRDRKIFEFGLCHADAIAAQSRVQAGLLKEHYGLDSTIVNMAVEIPALDGPDERDIDVLWVNNLRDFKRPELFCELAAAMPEASFVMIGGAVTGHEKLHRRIVSAASKLRNLEYVGAVPYHRVNEYFLRSKVFANTSDSEGFPNSFLQAWVRRVPVVSFFDPDSTIERNTLGVSPRSMREAIEALRAILSDEGRRVDIGEKAREFVLANYAPKAVVDVYIDKFISNLG